MLPPLTTLRKSAAKYQGVDLTDPNLTLETMGGALLTRYLDAKANYGAIKTLLQQVESNPVFPLFLLDDGIQQSRLLWAYWAMRAGLAGHALQEEIKEVEAPHQLLAFALEEARQVLSVWCPITTDRDLNPAHALNTVSRFLAGEATQDDIDAAWKSIETQSRDYIDTRRGMPSLHGSRQADASAEVYVAIEDLLLAIRSMENRSQLALGPTIGTYRTNGFVIQMCHSISSVFAHLVNNASTPSWDWWQEKERQYTGLLERLRQHLART